MRARGYAVALLVLTVAQIAILVGVYGSRLTSLDVPLTFAWTQPPANSELWRPAVATSHPNESLHDDRAYTQVDTYLALTGARLLVDGTWNSTEPRLAAPEGGDSRDFPVLLDRLDVVFGLALGRLVDTPAVLANVFLLASFFFVLYIAVLYLWAWRPGSRWLAPLAAIAIANAPYHFIRENFFSANYVLVVPTIISCLLLATAKRLTRLQAALLVAWVIAAPFFGLYNGVTAALMAWWMTLGLLLLGWRRSRGRARRSLVATGWISLWIGVWLVIDLIPSINFWAEAGTVESLRRTTNVADKYPLRLLDLVTQPDTLLSLPILRRSSWLESASASGEGVVVGGLVGIAACALLAWWAANALLNSGRPRSARWMTWMSRTDVRALAWMLAGIVALCAYGGAGTVLNAIGLSPIKSWERVAFVAYPVMVLIVLLVAASWRNARGTSAGRPTTAAATALAVLVVAGALAGVPWSSDAHGAAAARQHWVDLEAFYQSVERSSGKGPALYLPVEPYPEGWQWCDMPLYSSLIGPALTSETQWGSGANSARDLGERQFAVTSALLSDPSSAVQMARANGYTAVVVDVRGLPEELRQTVVDRLGALGLPTTASASGLLRYFDISGVAPQARPGGLPDQLSEAEFVRSHLNPSRNVLCS